MTIYNQISANKIKTFFLIAFFIGLITFFFFVIGKFVDDPQTFFIIGLVFSVASSFGSYFYSDKIVLFMSGAKPAKKRDYFDYYTVVENLSIAAGLPMPKLYVIQDASPNAFATGRDPKHAVVAATTGILHKLDRAELEGVMAHELSHIKNYDILVASMVAVLVGVVVFISDWMTRSIWWGGLRTRDNDRRSNPISSVIFIVLLIVTPLAATFIQLAISRRREFLADASGSLLTRYPEGLARALEKISADPHMLHTATNSTAHLFIVNPFQKQGRFINWLAGLFSTHPPVQERIRILREM